MEIYGRITKKAGQKLTFVIDAELSEIELAELDEEISDGTTMVIVPACVYRDKSELAKQWWELQEDRSR